MLRLFQPFQSIMGLSAVCRSDMENEPAFHGPGFGVFVLRTPFYRLSDAFFDGLWNIEQLICPFQGICKKISADPLHLQNTLQLLQRKLRQVFQILFCQQCTESVHIAAVFLPLPKLGAGF